MTIGEMLNMGGDYTIMGLALLFGFVIVMFIAIYMVGTKLGSAGNSPASSVQSAVRAPISVGGAGNAQVIAAISAAVREYQAEMSRR